MGEKYAKNTFLKIIKVKKTKMHLEYIQFNSTFYSDLCPDSVVAYHLALSENSKQGFTKRPGPGFKSFISHVNKRPRNQNG